MATHAAETLAPPSVAKGDSFPQIAQTSAEVWESADADAASIREKMPPIGASTDSQRFSRNLLSKSNSLTLGFDFVSKG